jgi:hypothetical protein
MYITIFFLCSLLHLINVQQNEAPKHILNCSQLDLLDLTYLMIGQLQIASIFCDYICC